MVGGQLLAMIGNRVDGDVCVAGIGAGVAGDEVGGLKEDIRLVAGDASQRGHALNDIVERIADCIVHGCLVVPCAREEMIAKWV